MSWHKLVLVVSSLVLALQSCGGGSGGESVNGEVPPVEEPQPNPPQAAAANPDGPLEIFAAEHGFFDTAQNLNRKSWNNFGPAEFLLEAVEDNYVGENELAVIDKHSAGYFTSVLLAGTIPVGQSNQFSKNFLLSTNVINTGLWLGLSSDDIDALVEDVSWVNPETGSIAQGETACADGGRLYVQTDTIVDDASGESKSTTLYDLQNCEILVSYDGIVVYADVRDANNNVLESYVGYNDLLISNAGDSYKLTGAVSNNYRPDENEDTIFSANVLVSSVDDAQQTIINYAGSGLVENLAADPFASRNLSAKHYKGELVDSRYGKVEISTPTDLELTLNPVQVFNANPEHYRAYKNADNSGEVLFAGLDNSHASLKWIGTGSISDDIERMRILVSTSDDPAATSIAFPELILDSVWLDRNDDDEDGIENGMEAYLGLDPLLKDNVLIDADFDGQALAQELKLGTDASTPDSFPRQAVAIEWVQQYNNETGQVELQAGATFSQTPSEYSNYVVEQGATFDLTGSASFIESELPSTCELNTQQSVTCTHSNLISDSDISASQIYLPVDVQSSNDGTTITGQLLNTWMTLPDDVKTSTDLRLYSKVPKIDLVAPKLTDQLINVNAETVVVATIEQAFPAPETPITIDITPSQNVNITDIRLISSGNDALINRCTVDHSAQCTMPAVNTGDVLTVEVSLSAMTTGTGTLEWEVSSDLPEWRLDNNRSTTNLNAVGSMNVIQALVDLADPDETIQLPSGIYEGSLDLGYKPINLIGSTGTEKTVFMSNVVDQPIVVDPGHFSTFDSITFQTSGSAVFRMLGENVTISNSIIEPIEGVPHSLDTLIIAGDAQGFRFRESIFRNWGSGVDGECKTLLSGISAWTYQVNIYLDRNVFENNNCDVLFDMALSSENFGSLYPNFYLNNNTIVGSKNILKIKIENDFYNGQFRIFNNIFIGTENILDLDNNNFVSPDRLITSSNLIWFSAEKSVLTPTEAASFGVEVDVLDRFEDPGFVSLAGGDYNLSANSNAIDTGAEPYPYAYAYSFIPTPEQAGSLTDSDFLQALDGNNDGVSEFDIGAFEYIIP